MAKFFGPVGFGVTEENPPDSGIWTDVIVEHKYYGDVLRNSRQLRDNSESLNNDLAVQNSISVVADAYANENFFAIRYIKWMGTLWSVSDVTVESPRLILKLGGVYNGPKAEAPSNA